MSSHVPFALTQHFVDKYRDKPPPFGFNGLGHLVYQRSYSRTDEDGSQEEWHDTVERVVNGTYNMQKRWIEQHGLGWNPWRAQRSAQEMFDRIFHMKFLPPGRGLWAMGSPLTEERQMFAALNNCAFVSTSKLKEDPARPFAFLMDAAMLGVGVGFDTRGAKEHDAPVVKGALGPSDCGEEQPAVAIPDNRQGWVDSVSELIRAHFDGAPRPAFDYSLIRAAGEPIRGFGGVAGGPDALKVLHSDLDNILGSHAGQPLTVRGITDVMNAIGRCLVDGNVRATAEIAFGEPGDEEFLDLKDFHKNPERAEYGWASNNSVFAELGMDYGPACERITQNGEPGFAWLENMRAYGRMGDEPDFRDHRAMGGNPCLEQTLESYELCCLVETFPHNHDDIQDFLKTLKFAYLYAKTVTLGPTHWARTNRVMLRNRRIGCSLSGIAQFLAARGTEELRRWCDAGYEAISGYDEAYSEWLAIPRSIKTTCIKPSGTVSLLAGSTPGMHYPQSRFYIRRVRLSSHSPLLPALRAAGVPLVDAVREPNTVIAEFPVDVGEGVRTLEELSVWEQLSLASFLQRHWADNQVSCTATFDPATEGQQLPRALDYFQYQLKGVSFLPRSSESYPQMPYEAIAEEEYHRRAAELAPQLSFARPTGDDAATAPGPQLVPDNFCDSDACELNAARGSAAGARALDLPDR